MLIVLPRTTGVPVARQGDQISGMRRTARALKTSDRPLESAPTEITGACAPSLSVASVALRARSLVVLRAKPPWTSRRWCTRTKPAPR